MDKRKTDLPSRSPRPPPQPWNVYLKQILSMLNSPSLIPDDQANHEMKGKQVNLGPVYTKLFLSLFLISLYKCVRYNHALFLCPKIYTFVPLGKFILF